jgi:hypothetical protein
LYVDRSHRRSGIASNLWRAAIDCAHAIGASAIYVSAVPSDSAVGFYLDVARQWVGAATASGLPRPALWSAWTGVLCGSGDHRRVWDPRTSATGHASEEVLETTT